MLKIVAAMLAFTITPALACDDVEVRLLKDQVRALEKQARSLERLERLERDRNRMIDREIRNRRQ